MQKSKIKMQNFNVKLKKVKAQEAGFTPTPISHASGIISRWPNSNRFLDESEQRLGKIGVSSRGERGFTLVETLIAISVLLLSVAGPLTIASRGLISASFARDQVTAFYLTQEATETIRNKRDNNSLSDSPVDFTSLFSECVGQSCIIDATLDIDDQDAIQAICSPTCPPLKHDANSGLYGYTTGIGWADSKFTRSLTLTEVSPTEMQLTVTISWNNGPINKVFSVQENLRDWQ